MIQEGIDLTEKMFLSLAKLKEAWKDFDAPYRLYGLHVGLTL